jgi:colanic acid/amylovoran biosynthesis glycosyltransferase
LLKPAKTPNPGSGEKAPRIGYLMSRYPAVSHTFLLKEVLGMRERGNRVQTASINPADRSGALLSEIEAEEVATTFYIKRVSAGLAMLHVLAIAAWNPIVTLRGLAYALRLGGLGLHTQAYALFYLAEALLVGDWMGRQKLAHLHVHFGGPVASVGLLTAKAWQVPMSLTLHGPDEFFDEEASYLRQKIETAKFVICISDYCRSQVMRIAPHVAESRFEVVRLGVDCEALRTKAPALNGSLNTPVQFVCTGRMVAAKGHRILVEAAAGIQAAGIEFTLVLIGDGAERSALEALTRERGIAERVKFMGSMAHNETLRQVSNADVFVLASFAEGLPVALMEAMALGVPCVSTPIAAIPELIHDGENGLLVSPANVRALSAAMERLALDPELRMKLGEAARETVEESYNLSRNLDQLSEVLHRRLGEKS